MKNMGIDPNTLAMWDDGLVEAWKNDKRFTLLIGTEISSQIGQQAVLDWSLRPL